jgi:riboflavin synthase
VFTGIVRERGEVVSREGGDGGIRLVVLAPETAGRTRIGDSVSIGGVCLTAIEIEAGAGTVAFDAVPETLARSSLGGLEPGDPVNVEPALHVGDPLGGHFVQGHVDGVGRVRALEPEGEGSRLSIEAPPEVLRYCIEKGSVTVEGVSLTIAALEDGAFAVALVPHTLAVTTLGSLDVGDAVNLEADMLAKYVERLSVR